MLTRPVVGPGKAAVNKPCVNSVKGFLDTDNCTRRQNLKGDISACQGGHIVHEVAKHLHFGCLRAENGLHFDMNLVSLRHDRCGQHCETHASSGNGRSQFGKF